MGYIGKQLWDILGKHYGIYQAKTVGYIWQKLRIYWIKTKGFVMGYMGQKLWDIQGKNGGIYLQKLRQIGQ